MLANSTRGADTVHPGAVDRLNSVSISAANLEAALEALAHLPIHAQRDPVAQALTLQAYGREAGLEDHVLAAAALHARVTALAKWTASHNPDRQSDVSSVMEAAARFPLCELGDGIGFEAAGFQETILFIEELPW